MRNCFFSCDWGTTSFRLRLVETYSLKVVAEVRSDEGIAKVYANWQLYRSGEHDRWGYYNAVLERYVAQIEKQLSISLNDFVIVISGMASSSMGMKELSYKQLPISISDAELNIEAVRAMNNRKHDVLLISGARTGTDVMRGEETQLLGCSVKTSAGKQLFLFPGTHSKHVVVENDKAIDFKTYMTGELFQLLSSNSILSKSITHGGAPDAPGNETAFVKGVLESQDQNFFNVGFRVRTNDLFNRFSKEQNYWYLSGLVIGTELNELLKQPLQAITLVSEGRLLQLYEKAFKALDTEMYFQSMDVNEALLKAHQRIYFAYYLL